MNNIIGVMVDSFRLPILDGVDKAREVGARAVQVYIGGRGAVTDVWTRDFRAQMRERVRKNGLVVSAMCGDMGGHGFSRPQENEWRVPETIKMLELLGDLECRVLTTHIGVIPEDPAHPRYAALHDAMAALGARGAELGVSLAIETGPESPATLGHFLSDLPASVGVNYDPANLVMVLGEDPVRGVHTLAGRIYHTHAKDGRMIKYLGAEKLYGFFAEGGIEDLRMEEYILETPLGQGDARLPEWLNALNEIGYTGAVTIEREVGADPEADIRLAVGYLQKYMAQVKGV